MIRKDLTESQQKLYSYGQQIGGMLRSLNWPPELLQMLPTSVLAQGDIRANPQLAATAAAEGMTMVGDPGNRSGGGGAT